MSGGRDWFGSDWFGSDWFGSVFEVQSQAEALLCFVGVIAGASLSGAAEFLCDVFALSDVFDKFTLKAKATVALGKLIDRVSESAVGVIAFFALDD